MAARKKTPPESAANGAPATAPAEEEPKSTRMTGAELERRIVALEAEVARLKAVVEEAPNADRLGWRRIVGSFANDPAFDEAMRLGREWRESSDRKRRSRKVKSSDDRP